MEFARLQKTIRTLTAWFQIGKYAERRMNEEILKPLNKLIDFKRQKCIFENNIDY